MFFGLPVVAYDLHETRVSAGAAGLYAEANSEQALARCIVQLAPRSCGAPADGRYGTPAGA